ncbi:MAG: hypothetical protein GC153_13085 [Alphaproteobacteria bacterium]|nr:hypothetical protein [Alphaproteobacteria bacterium]
MSIFADAVDDMFEKLGETAQYTPVGGETVDILVMPWEQDRDSVFSETRIQSSGGTFQTPVSGLASPARGATLVIGDRTYKIKDFRHPEDDPDRLIWFFDCAPQ